MTKKQVTLSIIVIFTGILAWDAYLYSDNIPGNSITQVVVELSSISALVPWFVGILMGFLGAHFFDNSRQL